MSRGNFARFSDDTDDLAVVIALDPGGTTGYCVMGVDPATLTGDTGDLAGSLRHICYGEIDCGTKYGQTGVGVSRGHDGLNISGEYEGIIRMVNLVEEYPTSVVVVEDFVLDVRKANMGRELLTPVRIISGLSTLVQYSFGAKAMENFYIQNRSLAKTTCTDIRLQNWGLYDGHSGPHARDATRHAFYFLRTCCGHSVESRVKRHNAWPDLFDDPHNRGETGTVKKPKPKAGQRIPGLG